MWPPSSSQYDVTEAVLVANRGEVALRVFRSARELGMRCVAVHTSDEADAVHVREADDSAQLLGDGIAAYLDPEGIVAAARQSGCKYVHPGYGFLSESADLARACLDAGLVFVGPIAEHLELFGIKTTARTLAERLWVPVLPASPVVTSLEQAVAFMGSLNDEPVVVKSLAGGGGRGIRVVTAPNELEHALQRCKSEAERSFGNGDVYLERCIGRARHIEVQVIGDGESVVVVGDRDCSLQRRRQKVIEIAPAPDLEPRLRKSIHDSARVLFEGLGYRGLATVEFLADLDSDGAFWFLEVNPRLQVEHGVTEETTGFDLVAAQLRVARGETLAEIGLADGPLTYGNAVEVRITLEGGGTNRIEGWSVPQHAGIRVETCAAPGTVVTSSFDPLLAKIIAFGNEDVVELSLRLSEHLRSIVIEGPTTNLQWVTELLASEVCATDALDTSVIEARLADAAGGAARDSVDAVASTSGVVILVQAEVGQVVRRGEVLAILESMKMEQEILAGVSGRVTHLAVKPGEVVDSGQILLQVEPEGALAEAELREVAPDDQERESLRELRIRRASTLR